ncbi:MAG: type II secretion system F family protein [Propioniciclava sp.]
MTAALAAVAAAVAVWFWIPPSPLVRLAATPGQPGPGVVMTHLDRWRAVVRNRPRGRRGSRGRASVASVPHTCELLAVCLQAGAPPRTALSQVARVLAGPPRENLQRVLHRIDLGVDEADAWLVLAEAPGYERVARDIARSVRHGAALADLLRRHADAARADAQSAALARARVAGVKSVVPLVVCFLPAFLLVGVVPILATTFATVLG